MRYAADFLDFYFRWPWEQQSRPGAARAGLQLPTFWMCPTCAELDGDFPCEFDSSFLGAGSILSIAVSAIVYTNSWQLKRENLRADCYESRDTSASWACQSLLGPCPRQPWLWAGAGGWCRITQDVDKLRARVFWRARRKSLKSACWHRLLMRTCARLHPVQPEGRTHCLLLHRRLHVLARLVVPCYVSSSLPRLSTASCLDTHQQRK